MPTCIASYVYWYACAYGVIGMYVWYYCSAFFVDPMKDAVS